MTTSANNKHATRSAQTRERFIGAAQQLYAERSIDSVSLNEITVAAGQKNRNALQYHFGNRDGLLQAIIDKHADRVFALRRKYQQVLFNSGCSSAEAAAQPMKSPIPSSSQRSRASALPTRRMRTSRSRLGACSSQNRSRGRLGAFVPAFVSA